MPKAPFTLALAALCLLSFSVGPPPAVAATDWPQLGDDIPGTALSTDAGKSVAISDDGSIIAVGSWENTTAGPGSVRVYEYSSGSWTPKGSVLTGAVNGDYFGNDIALSSGGLTLAIGAPQNSSARGQVSVYTWNGTAWALKGSAISGSAGNVRFGHSVSLSNDGDTLAAGAPGTSTSTGAVLVYTWNSGTSSWDLRGTAIAGTQTFEETGEDIALSGDGGVIVFGAKGNDDAGTDRGEVRVYAWSGSAWVARGSDIPGEANSDRFGDAVTISDNGSVIAVGAHLNDGAGSAAGHVRTYSWDGSSWSLRGAEIDGGAAGDNFGYSLSLSSDGLTLAVGAPETSSATGQLSLSSYESGSWTESVSIAGGATGEKFGSSVALAGDGLTVVAGAPEADTIATNSGLTRVFRLSASQASAASAESAGTPGIYLHVAGPIGRQVAGSPVYYGSDRVATTSTYLLTITNASSAAAQRVLASGVVDSRGNLEARVVLPALAPGTYDVVFEGKHARGAGLRLTARMTVGSAGQITALAENVPEIW